MSQWLVERFGNGKLSAAGKEKLLDTHGHNPAKVAKKLGVDKDMALGQILKYAKNCASGQGHPFSIAALFEVIQRYLSEDPDELAIGWAMLALDAKYEEQRRFHHETGREFWAKAQIETITGPKGKSLTMVTIESDDTLMNKYARSGEFGANADIIIQKTSSGNVQIYTSNRARLRLDEIAAMLRVEEQRLKGKIITWNWNVLRQRGRVPGAPEWYYTEDCEMLLNGSLTAPDVSPTKISLARIQAIIMIGLNLKAFRYFECQKGSCQATCYWRVWGLTRCKGVRHPEFQRLPRV